MFFFNFSYENSFLFSQLINVKEPLWIGFNDIQAERQFRWTDQSSVTFTYWRRGRYGGYRYSDDCVLMLGYGKQDGRWTDVGCSLEHGFICMKGGLIYCSIVLVVCI